MKIDEVRADESDVEIFSGSVGFSCINAIVGIFVVVGIVIVIFL